MKRFFALALVLVMALSMMAMTASAAPFTCPTHGTHGKIYEACEAHPNACHYYIYRITPDNKVKFCMFAPGTQNFLTDSDAPISEFAQKGFTPTEGMQFYDDGVVSGVCNPSAPAAKPQPKTGVADTLPLWFGVMAVSACAYVLTSKKKVF